MKKVFAILVALTTIPILAADITITNSDFETQTVSDGAWTSSITGWTLSDNSGGLFNPGSNHFSFEAGSGVNGNTAYSNGAAISQVLSTNLAADTTYTLTVDVGNRLDTSFPGYTIQLIADGVTLATKSGTANSVAVDDFQAVELVYTTVSGDPTGEPIEIHLTSCGFQTNFDNVTLSTGDNPCASITTDTIDYNLTLDVSTVAGDFATIQDALECLNGKTITGSAIVTIQVADGTYTDYDQVDITHPQGSQIHIVGDVTDATAVKISFKTGVHGFVIDSGYRLGLLDGMTVDGFNDTKLGVHATENAFARLGDELIIEDWGTGCKASFGAMIEATGTTSRNNGFHGFTVDGNAFLSADNSVSDGNGYDGYSITNGSTAFINSATSKNNGQYGVHVFVNSAAKTTSITYSNNTSGNQNTDATGVIY